MLYVSKLFAQVDWGTSAQAALAQTWEQDQRSRIFFTFWERGEIFRGLKNNKAQYTWGKS